MERTVEIHGLKAEVPDAPIFVLEDREGRSVWVAVLGPVLGQRRVSFAETEAAFAALAMAEWSRRRCGPDVRESLNHCQKQIMRWSEIYSTEMGILEEQSNGRRKDT
jgi:hypothetical protein